MLVRPSRQSLEEAKDAHETPRQNVNANATRTWVDGKLRCKANTHMKKNSKDLEEKGKRFSVMRAEITK